MARDTLMDWANTPSSEYTDMSTFGGFLEATEADLAKFPLKLAGGISEYVTDLVGTGMQAPAYIPLKFGGKDTQMAAVDWLDAMEKAKDMVAWADPDRRRSYEGDSRENGYTRTYGHADIPQEEAIRNGLNAFETTSFGDVAKSAALGVRDAVTMPLAVVASTNPEFWFDDSATGIVIRSLIEGDGAFERSESGDPDDNIVNSFARNAGFVGGVKMKGKAKAAVTHALKRADKGGSAPGPSRYGDFAKGLFAGDSAPGTIFGIPVVSEGYAEADLAFFDEHPEAGGFYQMGDETDEDQGAVGGGATQQVRRDGAAGAPRDWARKETFKVLGLNEFGGNLDPGADRPHYYFRDADGKIEGYGTTRSGTFRDGDSFVVIPTIVNGELLSDGDAFDRYRKTGEHWAKTDTREAGDAVARRIHDRSEGRDRAKWNEYIFDHWDEMSGKVTSDKWLRAEHTRRVSREAAVRANSGANAVMSAVSPVRRDDKGGWSPYDNAEAAIAKALPFIKEHEKFVGKAYWDKEGGKWTVGHGHTRIRDAKTGKMRNVTGTDTMDEKTSSTLVESIVRHNAAQIYRNRVWSRNVGPDALAAMYDVAYNAGPSVFDEEHSPNLNSEMESADMDFDSIIWNAIPSYRTVGGKVIKGLETRRSDSVRFFRDGQPYGIAAALAKK